MNINILKGSEKDPKQGDLVNQMEKYSVMATADDLPTLIKVLL